MQLIYLIAR